MAMPEHGPVSSFRRKVPKNLRYPLRAKASPDPEFLTLIDWMHRRKQLADIGPSTSVEDEDDSCSEEALSLPFQGRVPQKPGKLGKDRSLPLPVLYKIRSLGLPTPKDHITSYTSSLASSRTSIRSNFIGCLQRNYRSSIRKRVYRNAIFLIELAWEIRNLPPEKKKIWAYGIAVESTRNILLGQARKLLLIVKVAGRTLDPSIHAKLIADMAKNPEKQELASVLIEKFGNREEFKLKQQDCTTQMKEDFEAAESLFTWFKNSGQSQVLLYHTELLDIFLDLKEAGFCPTYDIYRDIIKIYVLNGSVVMCREVSKEAELEGFKLNGRVVMRCMA
ncbi:hypothetical protein EJ110_NYTH19624 [Nymphaea thermarum]|nr:hypothetical protein EJ110_NYTH19624 [Nymphaea thermarum]